DFARLWVGARAGKSGVAVDCDAHVLPQAHNFHAIPFSSRLFDFMRATRPFYVFPGIATGTIEAGRFRSLCLALYRQGCAFNHEDVTGPAFNDLSLDGFRPHLVLADKVHQDAAISCIILARRPGFAAPSELSDE